MFTPVFTRRRITKAPYLAASTSWPLREVVGLGVFNLSEKSQISDLKLMKSKPPEISEDSKGKQISNHSKSCQSYKAKETKAAEPMAKPFPMAAVVLPAASKASVRRRTSGLNKAISWPWPSGSAKNVLLLRESKGLAEWEKTSKQQEAQKLFKT